MSVVHVRVESDVTVRRGGLHATPAGYLLLTVGAVVDRVLAAINAEGNEATAQVTPVHRHRDSNQACMEVFH